MKMLVTGGAGFIGSNFVRYILKKYNDYEVVNFDALTYAGNLENLADIEKDSRYTFIKGDICNAQDVEKAFEGVDVAVHFAAESHVDRSILGPETFIKTNVLGTFTLLEEAKKRGVKRFHHVSTDEVYGTLQADDAPFNESTPYDPRSPYSASKAASDHLVRAYHETYGLPVTISNCSNNYGPYHFPEKLIPLAVTHLVEGKKIPIYGDGMQVRDWLHVEDHCRAIDVIIREGKDGETYCVGGDGEMANIDIVRAIIANYAQLTGKGEVTFESSTEFVKDRPGHDRRYAINFSKIRKDLGWEPKITFQDGLAQTVAWLLDNEDWWRRCKSGEYQEYYNRQYC